MPRLNDPVKLALQLPDGNTGKYVRATLRNADESVTYSPVDLDHVSNGLYVSNIFLMPNQRVITCQYTVFDDAGYSVINTDYTIESEAFELTDCLALDDPRLDNLDAAISDAETETDADVRATAILSAISSLDLSGGSGSSIAANTIIGILESEEELKGIVDDL